MTDAVLMVAQAFVTAILIGLVIIVATADYE